MKQYVFFITFFFVQNLFAVVNTRYQVLYTTSSGLQIENVVLSDTATSIDFVLNGRANSSFQIKPTAFLCDENNRTYAIRGAGGIDIDKRCYIPKNGRKTFRLHFAPMDKNVRVFDFIEGTGRGMFRMYGIHQQGNLPLFPDYNGQPVISQEDNTLFRQGRAVVVGNIAGYSRDKGVNLLWHDVLDMANGRERRFINEEAVFIAADGSFKMELELDCPAFFILRPQGACPDIPVYVRPSDSLNIQITGLFENNMRVDYKNNHPQHSCTNLLQHLPPVIFSEWESRTVLATLSREEYYATVNKTFEDNVRLYNYFAWKYHFTPLEDKLARNRMRLILAGNHLVLANRIFNEQVVFPIGELYKEESFLGYDYELYSPRPSLDANDPSLSFFPEYGQYLLLYKMSTMMYFTREACRLSHSSENISQSVSADSLEIDQLQTVMQVGDGSWLEDAYRTLSLNTSTESGQGHDVPRRPFFRNRVISYKEDPLKREVNLPRGYEQTMLKRLLAAYQGRYISALCLDNPRSDLHELTENDYLKIAEKYAKGDDYQMLFICNGGIYSPSDIQRLRSIIGEYASHVVIDTEEFLKIQALLSVRRSMEGVTFTPDGNLLYMTLPVRRFSSFSDRLQCLQKMKP